MQRVTISMSDEFAYELQASMDTRGYDKRSEALRTLAQIGLEQAKLENRTRLACKTADRLVA
jgi:CopG family nickel-responsive transcriptional regulator